MTKSTLTKTKSSIEGNQGIGFETAAIAASVSPLGIIAMGTFPSSLVASGRMRRWRFDDTLILGPKRNPIGEELESSEIGLPQGTFGRVLLGIRRRFLRPLGQEILQ
jgi:hypothetical protein